MNWPSSSVAWCRLLLRWSRSCCYRIRPPCGSGLRGHTGAARRGRTGSPVSSTPPQTRGGSSTAPGSCPFCNEQKVLSLRFRKFKKKIGVLIVCRSYFPCTSVLVLKVDQIVIEFQLKELQNFKKKYGTFLSIPMYTAWHSTKGWSWVGTKDS